MKTLTSFIAIFVFVISVVSVQTFVTDAKGMVHLKPYMYAALGAIYLKVLEVIETRTWKPFKFTIN